VIGQQRLGRDEEHRGFARLAFSKPCHTKIREHPELGGVGQLRPFLLANPKQRKPRELKLPTIQKAGGGGNLVSQGIRRSRRRGFASRLEMNCRVGAGQRLALRGSRKVREYLRVFIEQFLDLVPCEDLYR